MKLLRTILGLDKPVGKLDAFLHELFIILSFCAFTAALSWPYVNYLRDAVADPGDPYLVAWILWWDYHQTFTDPINLFHSNLFYPFRYTLAFSEHCYGIALPFFPLFALGFRPLTVHAVALFAGFVACGYGAFRLARTLTGAESIAWVAGIIFAFVPFRFHLLSHLPYLFSPWIPLLFEALVLFVRERSWKRASWFGAAFFFSGLTSVSWFTMSLVPLVFSAIILLTRYRLWRERAFWMRSATTLGLAALALVPFMLPYYRVSKLYGFERSVREVQANSAWPIHWLSAENRNKLCSGLGQALPLSSQFKLFPGLLPIVLSLAGILFVEPSKRRISRNGLTESPRQRWVPKLDVLIFVTLALSILATLFENGTRFSAFFTYVTSERALTALTVAIIVRLCLAYPRFMRRGENANLVETLRSERRGDAFWLAIAWTIVGFSYSLGWNSFLYRICYDLLPMFRSMRVPVRGAMFAYLGLAVLAGLGTRRLALILAGRYPRIRPAAMTTAVCALLLFEFNAAPLRFIRGDVFPDAVTLRLKETPMRGGVVVLPAGADFNHRHILRSADHTRPLIVGTSGFNSTYEDQIEWATRHGPISDRFMDLLEKIPTSYVVVETHLILPERRLDYDSFVARAAAGGRLRFINRFDNRADLYAVVSTEPTAQTEAPMPLAVVQKEWAAAINEDPIHLLGQYRALSQTVYRFYVASYGEMPRMQEFLAEVKKLGQGVSVNWTEEQSTLDRKLLQFADVWTTQPRFKGFYDSMSNESYVRSIAGNAGIAFEDTTVPLVDKLNNGAITRAEALLEIVNSRQFVEKEEIPSLVLLHFFAYFQRNPDDPPDNNMRGFQHWVGEVERSGDTSILPKAFKSSFEYERLQKKR